MSTQIIKLNRELDFFRIQLQGTVWFKEKRELEVESLEWLSTQLESRDQISPPCWKDFFDLPKQPLERLIKNLMNYGLVKVENLDILGITDKGKKAIEDQIISTPQEGNWELLVSDDSFLGNPILGIWPMPKEKSSRNQEAPGPIKEVIEYPPEDFEELPFSLLTKCQYGTPEKLTDVKEKMLSIERKDRIQICYLYESEMDDIGPIISLHGSMVDIDVRSDGVVNQYKDHKITDAEYEIREDDYGSALNELMMENFPDRWHEARQEYVTDPKDLNRSQRLQFSKTIASNSFHFRDSQWKGEVGPITCVPDDDQSAQDWLNYLILDKAETKYIWLEEISELTDIWKNKHFAEWNINTPSVGDLLSQATMEDFGPMIKWHIKAPRYLIP